MKCNRTKEKKSLFLSAEVTSYHFRSGGSNRHHFVHRARILAHVFSRRFITILILFLGIANVGSSHPPCPCFLVFRFSIPLFSTCISYKLPCLNWVCCAQVFYVLENVCVCRLLLAIIYREFTAVLCYFLFSP